MARKNIIRGKKISSNSGHRIMIIALGILLFISVIAVIVIISRPLILSQSPISNWLTGNKTKSQTADIINGEPNITIFGSQVFEEKMRAAFELLAACAPEDLATADEFLTGIYESNGSIAGAQINARSTTIQVSSDLTKYLPANYSSSGQTFWYAGAIVHEARHSWQFLQPGLVKNWVTRMPEENNAVELDALNVQIATFQKCVDYTPIQQRYESETILKNFENMRDKMQELKFNQTE